MKLLIKRNYPYLVAFMMVVGALLLGLGSQRIIAYTVKGSYQPKSDTQDITNNINLFDNDLVHSIKIQMSDADYQAMLTTYRQTGAKDYFHATVVIDGVQVNDVGIRLKGNASLRTALGGRGGQGPGGNPPAQPGAGPGQGGPMPNANPMPDQPRGGPGQVRPGQQQPAAPNGNPGAQPRGGGFGGNNIQVPLLIKFDKFVTGQNYQGYDRLAVRSAGISYDASMLHEPVTNSVLRLAGAPATRTAYVGLQVNGKAEELYTLSQVIDQDYLDEYFPKSNGILYKAELNANMNYQGEDPSAYARSFSQETHENDADLAPLIKFLKFVSQSDDSTFQNELPAHLDVDSFAAYLAVNNLLVNADSMAGMGNNFYLYYDEPTGRFSVLMWDANESLGKIGMMGRPGGAGGSIDSANYDIYYKNQNISGPGMGNRGASNPLLTRFLANATFKALYEQKLKLVYEKAFVGEAIYQQLNHDTSVVRQANSVRGFVDAGNYEIAAASVRDFITRREAYLAGTALLGK